MATFSGDREIYDVFVSYCTEDVHVTSMSHFRKELGRKRIKAFIDDNIERGDSIGSEQVQAIKDSRIAVVVFSENYASSSCCLSELLEIVKCEKELGLCVIPIFYGFNPSHARKQILPIFDKTCPNITEELNIQWREALTKVANNLGFHYVTSENEVKDIEDITMDVLAKWDSCSPNMATLSGDGLWDMKLYDVFVSYCIEDVHVTFMSHFRKELRRKRVNVFKHNDIERGDSIGFEQVRMIKGSRIAVVVLSKNYASSSWCLSELLEIVKCEKELGQLVIPIFYGLDPSHVRIFEETCPNVTEELKIQWREALTKVANTLGYHSATWTNEAKEIEKIINDVLIKLLKTTSEDTEDPVGMNDHIAEMIELLQLESEEVKMVGIWGSPGIGKSTIARYLFSRLSRYFQGSAFLSWGKVSYNKGDYLEDYEKKLLLQNNLISKFLGGKDIKIDDLSALGKRLEQQKCLIVIDDLDDHVVLDALKGNSQWLGSGSRIIVVATDKDFFMAKGISCIYEVGLPSEEIALKIFCRYAFKENSPLEGFEKLALEIVRCAGSLPLGVRILGSSLRGVEKKKWIEDFIPRFKNRLDWKIGKMVRSSYESLCREDQEIFLRIALLFNLKKVNDIKQLLAYGGLNIEKGLENLVAKSLIHIRSNIVEMHPLLQSLGKEIFRKKSGSKPGKREFLVDSTEICDVLEDNTGTRAVVGISLNIDDKFDKLCIHKRAFKSMPNLRFLTISSKKKKKKKKPISSNRDMHEKEDRVCLPDSFDHLPPKLRLLCWDGYPMKSLPSNFCPENLFNFEMKNSKLERLWEGSWYLPNLKEVNLWGSENLKEIPDLSRAPNLEKLYIGYRLSWVKHPSSIRKFNDLTNSGMLECMNLEAYPTGTSLESPKRLVLTERSYLCLENQRAGMQPLIRRVTTLPASLTVLFLSGILNMVELPFSIQNLNKLTDLRIMGCTNLETLPSGTNLESLERLYLIGCPRLRTFPDISTNISELYLKETAVKEVPWWIQNFSKLKDLRVESCSKLEYVYLNISELKHLEAAYFVNCGSLTGADCNGNLSCLAVDGENVDSKLSISKETSSSLPKINEAKVDFRFINCFNLDQEALLQQLSYKKLILSGEEMPLYFTNQTAGSSFTNVPLLQASLCPPFFRFKVCALVVSNPKPPFGAIGVCMEVTCRFTDSRGCHLVCPVKKEYFSVKKGSHLLLSDCLFPLSKSKAPLTKVNYEHVDIKFHMRSGNSDFEIKRWGIRLSTDDSSPENRLGQPSAEVERSKKRKREP